MSVLNVAKRNMDVKAKHLRKEGIIPGTLYGKNLEESLSIQMGKKEVVQLLKTDTEGSVVDLVMDGKKISTLLREVSFKPLSTDPQHLSFQTLLAGETITSIARIILLNREKVVDAIQHVLSEIPYKAPTSELVERIEIDLDGFKAGDSVRISDLDIAKNSEIEVLIPLDSLVVSVVEPFREVEESEAEEEAATDEAPEEQTEE